MNVKRKGFTLIELLVVIAIIAILAAILFPVFAKAREKAMLSTCISNNKQLGTAFMLYTQDTNGRLPYWKDYNRPQDAQFAAISPNNTTWDVAIYPMVKTKEVFTCPSNKAPHAKSQIIRSYSLPRNVSGMPMTVAKSPSRTVLLMEKGTYVLGTGPDAPAEWFGQTISGASNRLIAFPRDPSQWKFPHDNGKVFLFLDGHAKWYRGTTDQNATDNPFVYNFGPFPADCTGLARLGYCGDSDSTGTADPKIPGVNGYTGTAVYGANLPF